MHDIGDRCRGGTRCVYGIGENYDQPSFRYLRTALMANVRHMIDLVVHLDIEDQIEIG